MSCPVAPRVRKRFPVLFESITESAVSLARGAAGGRGVAVLVVALLSAGGLGGAVAGPAGATPLDDAKAQVQEAQRAADAAAVTYSAAQTRLGEVEAQISAIKARVVQQRAEVAALRLIARRRAVQAYLGRDAVETNGFVIAGDPLDEIRRDKFLAETKQRDDAAVSRLNAASADLQRQQRTLDQRRADETAIVAQLAAQQNVVNAQLQAAQKALDALEEQLRQQLTAAAAQGAAAAIARSASNRGAAAPGANGMVCPVRGAVSFTDDWGAPRHQGSHMGNDLMAARGTPDVATVSGTVTYKEGATSGLGAYLSGDDGTLYYYFHLDRYEGGPRRVAQGEVIGYVGNTGDAAGGPTHTHFEMHPGHGAAIDPYPYIRPIC